MNTPLQAPRFGAIYSIAAPSSDTLAPVMRAISTRAETAGIAVHHYNDVFDQIATVFTEEDAPKGRALEKYQRNFARFVEERRQVAIGLSSDDTQNADELLEEFDRQKKPQEPVIFNEMVRRLPKHGIPVNQVKAMMADGSFDIKTGTGSKQVTLIDLIDTAQNHLSQWGDWIRERLAKVQ